MTKERFTEILKEYDYPDSLINQLWDNKPISDDQIDESLVRATAVETLPSVRMLNTINKMITQIEKAEKVK